MIKAAKALERDDESIQEKSQCCLLNIGEYAVRVDLDIYEKIKTENFHVRLSWLENRPFIFKSGMKIYLSRFILNAQKGQIVDHINRNVLDNRRSNLRIVTARQNSLNRILKNATGFIAVSVRKKANFSQYASSFRLKNKRLSCIRSYTPKGLILAAIARDRFVLAAKEEAYAPLNFPIFKNKLLKSILLRSNLNEKRRNSGNNTQSQQPRSGLLRDTACA